MKGKIKITPECAIVFLICMHSLLIFTNGTRFFNLVGSWHLYVLIVPLFLLYKTDVIKKIQLVVGCIIFYSLASYIFKGGSQILAVLLFWVVIFFIVGFKTSPYYYMYIKNAYCISSVIISLLLFIQHRRPYSEGADIARFGLFFSESGFYDVNFTSTFLTIPTILMFVDFYDRNVKHIKIVLFALIVNLLAIYLLGSRSGLVIVFGSVFAYALTSKNKKGGNKLVYIVGGIFLVLVILRFLPTGILDRVLSKGVIDGKNTTRYISWMYGLEAFKKNPIWGNGLYSTVEQIQKNNYWGTAYTAHNTYISFLDMYGIVGSIPIGVFLLAPIYYSIRKKYELYFLILYVGFLAQLFVIEAGFSEIMLIPVMFFWIYINCGENETLKRLHLSKEE